MGHLRAYVPFLTLVYSPNIAGSFRRRVGRGRS
jgi:hypothetical protein